MKEGTYFHWPLIRDGGGALVACGILFCIHARIFGAPSSLSTVLIFILFCIGKQYTKFIEYMYHGYILHARRLLKFRLIWRATASHVAHHRNFRDEFDTDNPVRLEHTTTTWDVFTPLLFIHYLLFVQLFPHVYAIPFFSGVTFHFVISYQTVHWFMHVRDSRFHTLLKILPWWERQKKHHWKHHHNPSINEQFSFPETWDYICRTKG